MTEIITCPKCRRTLQVPETYLGQTVECPQCAHQFTASSNAVSATPHTVPIVPAKPKWDDEPREEPDYRRRRRHDEDEDLDDLITLPRRHERLPPNRGGLIMALGLVSLIGGWMFCLPFVVGPVAWLMAHQDLRGIRDGHLDSNNENMVRTGQICGIISTIIVLGILGLIALIVYMDAN